VRKTLAWLTGLGLAALLAGWPLWHIVRFTECGKRMGVVCDPGTYLPFGWLAFVLTVVGVLALASAVILLLLGLVTAAVRQDRRERAMR